MKFMLTFCMALILTACDRTPAPARLIGLSESDRIELTAEFAEPIIERMIVEGAEIAAGDVLVRQDTARAEANSALARAELKQHQARLDELIRGPRKEQIVAAQASVDGARKALQFRQIELLRAQSVFEQNLTSTQQRDQAEAARDTAQADLKNLVARLDELLSGTTVEELMQAEALVEQAQARIRSLQIDLDRLLISAPTDGIVDTLPFEAGERPGVGQPIAVILAGRQSYARIYVPESVRFAVSPGTPAQIYVDGMTNPLQGRVRWVSSEAAYTPYFALTEHDRGRLSFLAKVDILDHERRIPDGIPLEVEIDFENTKPRQSTL